MRRPWWLVVVLGGVLAAAPAANSDIDNLDHNRRLLEKWRADPDHYERLQADLRAFYNLPSEEQERLRRIDRHLSEADPATRERLLAVLNRYRAWLENLEETPQEQVRAAQTPGERLKVIVELRQKEWIARQPEKIRRELENLPADQRAARMAELVHEEQSQKLYWLLTGANSPSKDRPTKLANFPDPIPKFVTERLLPRMSEGERERMRRADGKWPDLARTIRQMADKYPVLPPGSQGEIKEWSKLPPDAKKALMDGIGKDGRSGGHGKGFPGKSKFGFGSRPPQKLPEKWPEYALAITERLRKAGNKTPLGASKLEELPEEAKLFIRDQLLPSLDPAQRESMRKAEGLWPEYPKRLLELAKIKRKVIPGMSLPGPPEFWESALASAADVTGKDAYDYAMKEMTPQQRAGFKPSSHGDVRNLFEKIAADIAKKKRSHEHGSR